MPVQGCVAWSGRTCGEVLGAWIEGLRQALSKLTREDAEAPSSLEVYDLDPGVLSVLTEYEEHRLKTNVEQGVPLYRLRVKFALTTIDSDLEESPEWLQRFHEKFSSEDVDVVFGVQENRRGGVLERL